MAKRKRKSDEADVTAAGSLGEAPLAASSPTKMAPRPEWKLLKRSKLFCRLASPPIRRPSAAHSLSIT
jgi:hypothetical protein